MPTLRPATRGGRKAAEAWKGRTPNQVVKAGLPTARKAAKARKEEPKTKAA